MGWFSKRSDRIDPPRMAPLNASPENPSTSLANPDQWLTDWGQGGIAQFGPPISEQTAMAVSTVNFCVSLLSGIIAGTPLIICKDDPALGRVVSPDHRLSDMLGAVPFPGRPVTSYMWREGWGYNVYLWGNHYSAIRYDNASRVIGFEPALPWQVKVLRATTGRNLYTFTWSNGTKETLPQEDVLHIAGPGFDGIKGLSRIQSFARNAVSLARTFEENIGNTHENSAKPSGAVNVSPNISPEGIRRQRAFFEENFTGRANAGRVLFMDPGSKFTPIQMSPEDLNTISAMNHTAEDICRFFRVPPTMAGLSGTSAWGTGIEQNTLGFLRFTMESEFQRIEHELNAKLFSSGPFYAMFDRESLLAMNALEAAQVSQARINSGQMTPNEARAKLFLAAKPNGDELLVNSTIIPLSRAVNPPPPPAPIAPPAGNR